VDAQYTPPTHPKFPPSVSSRPENWSLLCKLEFTSTLVDRQAYFYYSRRTCMKSHSPRDKAFMSVFAQKLRDRREKAKESENVSYEEFARKLGLTRAGLLKYLKEENVPSPQMLETIYRVWGVQVGYGDLDTKLIKSRARRNRRSSEAQMLLPLAIEDLTNENITVELTRKKPSGIELNLSILFRRAN